MPAGELRGERVVAVEADEDDAVDVAGRQVADGPALVDLVVGHQQDELQVAGRQRRADAPDEPREERIVEQPVAGSVMTTAIDSLRRVTRLRAARLGT